MAHTNASWAWPLLNGGFCPYPNGPLPVYNQAHTYPNLADRYPIAFSKTQSNTLSNGGFPSGQEDSAWQIVVDSLSRIPESERSAPEQGKAQDVYDKMSQFTTENSSTPVKIIDYWLNLQSFFMAVLHGGPTPYPLATKSFKSAHSKPKPWTIYQPDKYLGILPGLYRQNGWARKGFIDPFCILGCIWDGFNAFFNYTAQYNSIGTGLIAGMAEAASAITFGCYYAEAILYPCMDASMKGLALLSPRLKRINQELAGDLPKKFTQKGIPLSYRLLRSFLGGAVGLVVIESLIRSFSHWITPSLAKSLGPWLDTSFGADPLPIPATRLSAKPIQAPRTSFANYYL